MKDDETLREIGRIKKNQRETFVVSEVVRGGTVRIEIRMYEVDGRREFRPTRHSMRFSHSVLEELQEMLRSAA